MLAAGGPLLVYAHTAAPSVLSGDSAEFQFAAFLPGVPHPTGYPLYTMLSWLATLVLPTGDMAHRVTLVSAGAGAATVALLALLVLQATGRFLAALVAAIALAVAPGMWNASTLAEVYTLNTLLLVLLTWLLWQANEQTREHTGNEPLPPTRTPRARRALAAAACVAGLGFTNHGSFALTGIPLLLLYGVVPLFRQGGTCTIPIYPIYAIGAIGREQWADMRRIVVWGAVGLLPWLFVLVQYARMGPFDGLDNGMQPGQVGRGTPYFWGAPASWSDAFNHLFGGVMRQKVFHWPGVEHLVEVGHALWERLWFEFGMVGIVAGGVGFLALLRSRPHVWVGSVVVAATTTLYFSSLGHAVQDAMVFSLPLLLPWALWVGVGAASIAGAVEWLWRRTGQWIALPTLPVSLALANLAMAGLLLLTLAWGHSRLPYGNKSHLRLFREFAEGTLARVEPGAIIITRWEQGTTLHYLQLVEEQRPDVWVDIVELEDEDWRTRARRRYARQTVYCIGNAADGVMLGAEPLWTTTYATLFRLAPPSNDDLSFYLSFHRRKMPFN